jgi:hypothetical protein
MPMKNPAHPGQVVRHDCVEALDLSVTDGATTQRLHACNGAAGRLLLPAAAQRAVNLHQGEPLMQPCL